MEAIPAFAGIALVCIGTLWVGFRHFGRDLAADLADLDDQAAARVAPVDHVA